MSDTPNYHSRTAIHNGIEMDTQNDANYASWLDSQAVSWDYQPEFVDSAGATRRLPYFQLWDSTAAHFVTVLANLPEVDVDSALARMKVTAGSIDRGAHLMVVQNLSDHANPLWWPVRASGPDDCFCCWPRKTIEVVRLLAAPITEANGEEHDPDENEVRVCRNCGSEEVTKVGVRTDMDTKRLVSEPVQTRLADVPVRFAAIPPSKLRSVIVYQCGECEFESYEGIIRTPKSPDAGGW